MWNCCRILFLDTQWINSSTFFLCTEPYTECLQPGVENAECWMHKLLLQATLYIPFSQYLFWKSLSIPFPWFTSEKRRKKKKYPRASSGERRDYVTLNVFCGRGEWKEQMMSESRGVSKPPFSGVKSLYNTKTYTDQHQRADKTHRWIQHSKVPVLVFPAECPQLIRHENHM